MASSTQPTITESELLITFLLAPSTLPTIVQYSSFLTLVPQSYRNNPTYSPCLKRLYRDLQFQRSITIDQVRINIERECGSHAASLRARLLRRIAIEEGDELAEREEVKNVLERRKRKRDSAFLVHRNDDQDDEEDAEDDVKSETNEFTDPRDLAAQRTYHDHESMSHPAAHVLPYEKGLKRRKSDMNATSSPYHTQQSLLRGMEAAASSLEKEIAELEAECAKSEASIRETVEGLSDLKYGKSRMSREQEISEGFEENSTFAEVLSALGSFQDLLKSKTSRSTLAVS